MTIYDALKVAGCELNNHESDLYVKATPEARRVLTGFPNVHPLPFHSSIDGALWFDLPFMFAPFWDQVRRLGGTT